MSAGLAGAPFLGHEAVILLGWYSIASSSAPVSERYLEPRPQRTVPRCLLHPRSVKRAIRMALLDTTIESTTITPTPYYYPMTEICRTTLANIGPLTTAFTAPSSCSTPVFSQVINGNATLFPCPSSQAYKDCLPHASVLSAHSNRRATRGSGCDAYMTYFSPGLSCPVG